MQEHATACGKRQGTKQQGRRMIQPEDIQYAGIYNITANVIMWLQIYDCVANVAWMAWSFNNEIAF